MKKPRQTALILTMVAASLLLFACSSPAQHQKAIEQAIVGYSDYYIVVRDLSSQVKDGFSKIDPKQSVVNYMISVEIPDYSGADFQDVPFTVPEPDATTINAEEYQKKSILSIRQALETYALKNPTTTAYISIPVTFDVMSSGNGWTASITTTSKSAIQQAVENSMLQILNSNEAYQKNVRFAQVNSDLAALLVEPLGGAEYAALVEFSNVTQTADGAFTASLSYPDPTAVYAALGEAYVNSYNQSFYGDPIAITLTADGLNRMDTSAMPRVQDTITASYDSATGTYALIDAKDLLARVTTARQQAEAAASAEINAAWRIEPLDPPESGSVLEGESAGNDIVLKTGATLGRYYYVRFYAISGEDVSEDGTLAAGMFIVGGNTAKILLPSGHYRISCFVGEDWYGPDTLFGKSGKEYAGKNAIESREGYVNTVSFQ